MSASWPCFKNHRQRQRCRTLCSAVAIDDVVWAVMCTALAALAGSVVVVAMVCFTRFLVVFDFGFLVVASTTLPISLGAASASVPSCAANHL